MSQENFHASVQYGDEKGTAVADRHDRRGMQEFLIEQGMINADEGIAGIEIWSGEVHDQTKNRPISVTVYVSAHRGFDSLTDEVRAGAPIQVRRIKLEMALNEFFSLFKRFSITISPGGILERKEIRFDE